MLVTSLFCATSVLYGLSCGLFLWFLVRGREASGRWGRLSLLGAVALHVGFLVMDFVVSGHAPFGDIHQTLAVLSLLISVAYLAAALRYRVLVLGAFITPVALLLFLGAGLGRTVGQMPEHVRSALLPIHVALSVLGIVAFALAFAAAVAYMIEERLLRRKQLTGVFQRLPPLDQLDSLGFRLVTIGFPLLTLGIVTGTIWAVRLDPSAPVISTTEGFAVLAWLVFAGVLLLRVAAGWRGRRAAIGTIMGFLCAMAVLVGYVVRAGGGGL